MRQIIDAQRTWFLNPFTLLPVRADDEGDVGHNTDCASNWWGDMGVDSDGNGPIAAFSRQSIAEAEVWAYSLPLLT